MAKKVDFSTGPICEHFAACFCTIWTRLTVDGYAASQISFTRESLQMWPITINAIRHFFMQQLSHTRGTVGFQLQCLLYKTMKQCSLYEAKKHIMIVSLNDRTLCIHSWLQNWVPGLYSFLFQLFLNNPNLIYLVWQKQHTSTGLHKHCRGQEWQDNI